MHFHSRLENKLSERPPPSSPWPGSACDPVAGSTESPGQFVCPLYAEGLNIDHVELGTTHTAQHIGNI